MTEPVEVENKVQSGRTLGHKETLGHHPYVQTPVSPTIHIFWLPHPLFKGEDSTKRIRRLSNMALCRQSGMRYLQPLPAGSGWATGTGHAAGECHWGRERKKCASSPCLLAATSFPSHLLVPRHRKTFLLVLWVQNNPLRIKLSTLFRHFQPKALSQG